MVFLTTCWTGSGQEAVANGCTVIYGCLQSGSVSVGATIPYIADFALGDPPHLGDIGA